MSKYYTFIIQYIPQYVNERIVNNFYLFAIMLSNIHPINKFSTLLAGIFIGAFFDPCFDRVVAHKLQVGNCSFVVSNAVLEMGVGEILKSLAGKFTTLKTASDIVHLCAVTKTIRAIHTMGSKF